MDLIVNLAFPSDLCALEQVNECFIVILLYKGRVIMVSSMRTLVNGLISLWHIGHA